MSDDQDLEKWAKIGVAGALSREFALDQRHFLKLLAQVLQHAFPDETILESRGFLFSKKELAAITLDLGDVRLRIEDLGKGPLKARRTMVVRGIALKTEEIPVEQCLGEIESVLNQRVEKNASVRSALASMLGLE